MKKLILTVFCFIFALTSLPAEAKSVKIIAESESEFSTENTVPNLIQIHIPPQNISGSKRIVEKDTYLKLKVIKITEQKVGKRDAYIFATMSEYSYNKDFSHSKNINQPDTEVKIKMYKPTDFASIGGFAASTVASKALHIPFLSQGYAAIKGAIKAEEGESKLLAAGKGVYESTPLKYIEKGEPLNAKTGTKLTLIFYTEEPSEEEQD